MKRFHVHVNVTDLDTSLSLGDVSYAGCSDDALPPDCKSRLLPFAGDRERVETQCSRRSVLWSGRGSERAMRLSAQSQ